MKLKRIGALVTTLALALSLVVVPAHAVEFTDVPKEFWGYDYIKRMSDKGYAKGYEDGTFKPNGKMTAVETLLFCARATGVNSAVQAKIVANSGKEIAKLLPAANNMNVWAVNEMAVAVEAGVLSHTELEALAETDRASVKTDEDGKITSARTYLEETMSREKICMYLVRAMQLEPLAQSLSTYSLSYKYADADEISPALQPYVYVLTNYGVVKGKDAGNFDPDGAVTRAEMTTMLCRALDFMEEAGIQTELSEYTDYEWQGGVITSVTSAAENGLILTLYSEASETTQSYAVPATAKIYEDNMLTSSAALKSGQYVRLNLSKRGAVEQVRLGGTLTTYSGSVADLSGDQLTITYNNQSRVMDIDRFTQVVVGKAVGGRELIDEEAGYTSAVCYVDATGHLAAVRFAGGTQVVTGLVESVTTANNVTTLGIYANDGTIHRYNVPTGVAITVNGTLSPLTNSYVGRYAKLRVVNESTDVQSVAIDTLSTYVQGPIKRLGTIGAARSVYINNIFTGKENTYTVSQAAAITYNGEPKTISELESGWYVTAAVNNNMIVQMDAFPGSSTVEGTLSAINYGTTTTLRVTKADGTIANYTVELSALADRVTINRAGKSSSIDQLRTGDKVTVTVRYNTVERIDAEPQTANLTGIIDKVTQERTGVSIEVTLSNGDEAEYTVSEGVSVTQNGTSSNIYNLKPGQSVAMVADGDDVISIDITAVASSSTELSGVVLVTNKSTKTMTVQVTDSLGKDTLVQVYVKDAALMDQADGSELSLTSGFPAGSKVKAFGAYDGAAFIATIVVKQ